MASSIEKATDRFSKILQKAPTSQEELRAFMSIGANYNEACFCILQLCEVFYGVSGYQGTGDMGSREGLESIERPKLQDATLLPVPNSYGPNDAAKLLSYASLYSRQGVLVLPLDIEDGYISYSGGPRGRTPDTVLKTMFFNLHYRDVIESGRLVFLPRHTRDWFTSLIDHYDKYTDAPFLQDPQALRFTPVNVGLQSTIDLLRRNETVPVAEFLLPYFPAANLEDILRIKDTESDSFALFSSYLGQRLASLSEAQSLTDIDDIQAEIAAGVARLRIEAKMVSGSRLMRNAEIGLFGLSVVAAASGANVMEHIIARVIGSASLISLLRSFNEVRDKRLDMRANEFFVPYLFDTKKDLGPSNR
jgi:hypothetical protein